MHGIRICTLPYPPGRRSVRLSCLCVCVCVTVGGGKFVICEPRPKYISASDTCNRPLSMCLKSVDNCVPLFFRTPRALGSAALNGDRLRAETEAAPVADHRHSPSQHQHTTRTQNPAAVTGTEPVEVRSASTSLVSHTACRLSLARARLRPMTKKNPPPTLTPSLILSYLRKKRPVLPPAGLGPRSLRKWQSRPRPPKDPGGATRRAPARPPPCHPTLLRPQLALSADQDVRRAAERVVGRDVRDLLSVPAHRADHADRLGQPGRPLGGRVAPAGGRPA